MGDFSIQILDTTDIADRFKDSNGSVFLDMPIDVEIQTKDTNIELGSVSNKNKKSASRSFRVKYTPKNNRVLSGLIDAHIHAQSFKHIAIIAENGGHKMPYNYLKVTNSDDSNRLYTLQLTDKIDHPLVSLGRVNLHEMDWGEFTLKRSNVEAQFTRGVFQDSDSGYIFAFDWFGRTKTDVFTATDLRPRYSPLAILRKACNQIGYKFESQLLETDKWRRAWLYLSDETYGGSTEENLDDSKFSARKSGEVVSTVNSLATNFISLDEVFDNSDTFDDASSVYIGKNGLTETLHLDYDLVNLKEGGRLSLREYVYESTQVYDPITGNPTVVLPKLVSREIQGIDITTTEAKGRLTYTGFERRPSFLNNLVAVGVGVVSEGLGDSFFIRDLHFFNDPQRFTYSEGQVINMGEPIDKTLTGLDILSDIQHATCGQINIDEANKSINLMVPFDVEDSGVSLVGYLQRDPKTDLTGKIISHTKSQEAPKSSKARYHRYGFKRPTDAHIRRLRLEPSENLFDKSIDLGSEYAEQTKQHRAKFIEPSRLIEINGYSNNVPIHMSALLDNVQGELSFNIGVRIGLHSGQVTQRYLSDLGVDLGTPTIAWYDTDRAQYPIFYQTLTDENLTLVGVDTTEVLVYGDHANDFWNKYLKIKTLSSLMSQRLKVDFWLGRGAYSLLSLSNEVFFQYGYEYIHGFIVTATYNHTKLKGSMEIQVPLQTISGIDGLIESLPDDRKCHKNKASITHSQTGTHDVFTLTNDSEFAIENVVWSYVDSVDLFQLGSTDQTFPTSSFSFASIPFVSSRILVKAVISYQLTDGLKCPTKTAFLEYDPCDNFVEPSLSVSFNVIDKKKAVRVDLTGSIISGTIQSIAATASIDGGSASSYNIDINTLLGDFLRPVENTMTLETMTVTFTNGCTFVLSAAITGDVSNLLKSNAPQIINDDLRFISQGRNRFVPDLTEVLVSQEPAQTLVLYRNSETDGYGQPWTARGVGPVGGGVEFKVVFTFDNSDVKFIDWTLAT